MIIEPFALYDGHNCESSATGCLLRHAGIELSEPMMIGLGSAFGFLYWKMKIMNLPFIGGRSKPYDLTRVLCDRLHIPVDMRETTSRNRAWSNIQSFIDQGIPVAVQADCYHLEHFHHAFHFAGHFICVYGYDETHAYVTDTGKHYKVSLDNLEKARFEKGPMAAKARSWTLQAPDAIPDIQALIPSAIETVAHEFLHPPLKSFGYKGIHKLGDEIVHWIDMAADPQKDITAMAEMMEEGGTGGALFRNLYQDFLDECQVYYPHCSQLTQAHALYQQAAAHWTQIAAYIREAGQSVHRQPLETASVLCHETAKLERQAMALLLAWVSSD